MPINKMNFIPPGKTAKARAKRTLIYIGDKEKEPERELFGHGGILTEEQALHMIDTVAKNTYFFRLIFSPSAKTENKDGKLNLQQLTTKLVEPLEERLRRELPF